MEAGSVCVGGWGDIVADLSGELGRGGGQAGNPKQLTHVSTEADGAVWSPDSQRILFVSRVYPECSDEESWLHEEDCNRQRDEAVAKSPVKAMVFDKLLYRHWNGYVGPKRSHVLVVSASDGNAVRDLTPRRMIGMRRLRRFRWRPDGVRVGTGLEGDCVRNERRPGAGGFDEQRCVHTAAG